MKRWRGFDSKTVRATVIAAGLLLLLFLGLFGWRSLRMAGPAAADTPPVEVTATLLVAADAPVSLQAVGSLRASREVLLAAEVAGRIVEIGFTSGSRTRAGETLVTLYDAPERADRAAALARVTLARAQLNRSRELSPSGVEPRARLDERQAEMDQALAAVAQLDARIAQKRILAPFAGHIGLRRANLGQYLNPGDAIATLVDLDPLLVQFTLPQRELGRVAVGAPVRVAIDAAPSRVFVARVSAIEPRIGDDTRNVTVEATLPNPDLALRPGMYATVTLDLPAEPGALVLPATAVQMTPSGASVVVVRGDDPRVRGKAELVPVTVGRRLGDRVVIARGLSAGDVVVTEGQVRLTPGGAVKVARLVTSSER